MEDVKRYEPVLSTDSQVRKDTPIYSGVLARLVELGLIEEQS